MEFEKLKSIIAEVLNIDDPEEITMDSTFTDDLGADSLDIAQILISIEDEFDVDIPDDVMENITTVGEACEAIREAL